MCVNQVHIRSTELLNGVSPPYRSAATGCEGHVAAHRSTPDVVSVDHPANGRGWRSMSKVTKGAVAYTHAAILWPSWS